MIPKHLTLKGPEFCSSSPIPPIWSLPGIRSHSGASVPCRSNQKCWCDPDTCLPLTHHSNGWPSLPVLTSQQFLNHLLFSACTNILIHLFLGLATVAFYFRTALTSPPHCNQGDFPPKCKSHAYYPFTTPDPMLIIKHLYPSPGLPITLHFFPT